MKRMTASSGRTVVLLAALLIAAGSPAGAQALAPLIAAEARLAPPVLFAADPAPAPGSGLHEPRCAPGGSRLGTGALQLVGGTAVGFGSVFVLGGLAAVVGMGALFAGEQTGDPVVLAYPAYLLGSSVAVHWIGRRRGGAGRFWPTLAGGVLGFGAPGAIVGYHLSDRGHPGCGEAG